MAGETIYRAAEKAVAYARRKTAFVVYLKFNDVRIEVQGKKPSQVVSEYWTANAASQEPHK